MMGLFSVLDIEVCLVFMQNHKIANVIVWRRRQSEPWEVAHVTLKPVIVTILHTDQDNQTSQY